MLFSESQKGKILPKKALEMHELFLITKDSIAKMDAKEELYKFELNKEYQLKKQVDSIKHADEILIHESEVKANKERLTSRNTTCQGNNNIRTPQ